MVRARLNMERFEKNPSLFLDNAIKEYVASGLQTRSKLKELGLQDIVKDLEQRGLVV